MGKCVWREPKGQQPLHSRSQEAQKGLVFVQAILALIIDKSRRTLHPKCEAKVSREERKEIPPEGLVRGVGNESEKKKKSRND
jgi:hypothetical protein